jgi:signal transduction histidine kinase
MDEAPQQMVAELDARRDSLSQNIRELRRAIFALRPAALDELGFVPASRPGACNLSSDGV